MRIPGPAGRAGVPADWAPRVVVVGGGIAGLAAAVVLAERGMRVVLFEKRPYLGGRAGGWPTRLRDGSTVTMTRGFHAFFRQYYNLRALLRRADPDLAGLVPLADYPLWHASGTRDGFTGLPRTLPWNALAFLLRSPTFSWRELMRVDARATLPMLDVSVPRVYRELDTLDGAAYLDRVRFPAAARALALQVFSRSFFADPAEMSAAELVAMFHVYFFGSAEGLLFDVPAAPFPQALWDPLACWLSSLGTRIRTGATVSCVEPDRRGGFAVGVAGYHRAVTSDAVVLATHVAGLRRLVASSPTLGTRRWREQIDALRTAPPFLVSRFWLDRPVRRDRPGFLATSGHDLLDNISVLSRYEDEARGWAARTGGSVVELHGYALPATMGQGEARRRLVRQLHRLYPETAAATVIDERHELRDDCPLFPPGGFTTRPGVVTPQEALVLAGDFVRVDLPVALMERAATTGFAAANHLLCRWGVAGTDLWSVPNAGRNRLLRALTRRFGRPPVAGHPAARNA